MEGFAKILFDFDKLPSKLILLVGILSGIILFVPPEYLQKVQLSKFNESYGHWVGIAFIFSVSFLIVTLITTTTNWRRKKKYYKGREESIKQSLKELDPIEQAVLREFYINGSSTLDMPLEKPTVTALQDKGILRLVRNNLNAYVTHGMNLPCTITDFAKTYIEANPQLINWPRTQSEMTEDKKQWLLENRPPWIRRDPFGRWMD